jgi:hypothetical protein
MIIDDIMIDARRLSSEALEMMLQANEKSAKAECAPFMSGNALPLNFMKSALIIQKNRLGCGRN